MKAFLICLYMLTILFADYAYGQTPAPVAAQALVAPTGAPGLAAAPAPQPVVQAPKASPAEDIAKASLPEPVTVKDESAAPPTWVQDLVVSIKSMPIIGPIAVKVLNWLTVLFSIITALCAFLLVVLKALSGVANIASLAGLSDKIEAFQNGKIMYYLKYLSVFNAQKKDKPEAAA